MDPSDSNITQLLKSWRNGDANAAENLVPLVYDRLRRIAGSHLRHERPGHTLAATALVHEAYLRLADAGVSFEDRSHFFAVASTAMRRVLVDHAKHHNRQRRGGGALRADFEEALVVANEPNPVILDIDEALNQLAKFDERKVLVVELTFFGGLTTAAVADAMGVSEPTIKRELRMARAWIRTQLELPAARSAAPEPG
jgi:RNA polymerase sigma factor (TIGR02999 family)